MKYRRTKSAILLLLIFSSLLLAMNVWFSNELWPNGYNFFIALKNTSFVRELFPGGDVYSMPKENLSKPQKMVLTNGPKRCVYYNSDSSYSPLYDVFKAFATETLRDEQTVQNSGVVDNSEWQNVLRNDELLDVRSLYVDYSLAYTPKLFAQIIGIKDTWLEGSVSAVKEFVIAPVSDGGEVLLYVKDYKNDQIYKYNILSQQSGSIYDAINDYGRETNDTYSFAFELNLDKRDVGVGSGVVQTVFLEPYVLISPESEKKTVISSTSPLFNNDANIGSLINTFNYKPGSVRRYTDTNGVEYFVENYSSLKIYGDGIIEYTAVDNEHGINLQTEQGTESTLYESLNSAIDFSERVWHSVMPEESFNVLVTSNLLENSSKPGSYSFTLDYYFEGTPISVQLSQNVDMHHAVEIEMNNGIIKSYRHFIRKFEKTSQEVTLQSPIRALDGIYKSFGNTETIIEDIFLSYVENGEQTEKTPVWCARIAGSDSIITSEGGGE